MSGNSKITVLITGGSGVLGDSLISKLADRYHLVCLVRRRSIRHDGVELVYGDIRQPRMGLSANAYVALLARIDWVIHCAAVTRLNGHNAEIFEVNCQGTVHVLAFARDADVPFYHVSTAFTLPCEYHTGVLPQTPYEATKRKAETLVREAGVAASIFRPSIIIGDSLDGHIPNLQGFHLSMGLVMSGFLPIIPCPESGRVDLIPRDVVAAAIASALDQRLIGDDYNLTSGAQALEFSMMLDLMCAEMQQQHKPFRRPRCLQPDVYERLVRPVFLPALDEHTRAALAMTAQMCRYASLRQPLPSSLDELLPAARLALRNPRQEMMLNLAQLATRLGAVRRMLNIPLESSRTSGPTLEVAQA
ncbi:SDR family oxidoreductase [Pseudomonas sp. 8O]|uniref:SDR family oxidoreductase n=1 Tax=Pseudomonas sp. 8O TaxID=2653165 RepID=UPI0012F3BEF1|nr:SDR family oxidoreductase [Pseudomonas sp. 8O]VXC40914.1 NAD-dependent epimerase [Pseudomonas sp. 8O]